jgi:hypothetical protein
MCLRRPLRFVIVRRGSRAGIAFRSILAVALSLTVSVAAASVADPLWIQGVYDDGDHDVLVVTSVGAVGTAAALVTFPYRFGTLYSLIHTAWHPSRCAGREVKPRAPPSAATACLPTLVRNRFRHTPPTTSW